MFGTSNKTILDVKIGDIVYIKYNGLICEARVEDMITEIRLGGLHPHSYYSFLHTDYTLLLPDGTLIEATDRKCSERIDLYETVEDALSDSGAIKSKHIPWGISFADKETVERSYTQFMKTTFGLERGGVGTADWFKYYCVRKNAVEDYGCGDPTYFHHRHSKDFLFSFNFTNATHIWTIDEMRQRGYYPTYDECRESFSPKVMRFDTPKPATTRKVRVRVEIETEFDADGRVLSEKEISRTEI